MEVIKAVSGSDDDFQQEYLIGQATTKVPIATKVLAKSIK